MKGRVYRGAPPKLRDTMPAILRMWTGFNLSILIEKPVKEVRQWITTPEGDRLCAVFGYYRHEDGVPVYVFGGVEEKG